MPGGRPRIEIDYSLVEKLCEIQCTGVEIASILGVNYDTVERAVRRDKKTSFADYIEQKRGNGKVSLRRRQWKKATDEGNVTMLIWLGKQYLGQSDKQEITGANGDPFKIEIEVVHAKN